MTQVITLWDSVEANQIPANAQAAAGYVGGRFPDFLSICARFPALVRLGRVLSIAVHPDEKAHFLDVEGGDASPADFPRWYHNMVALGVWNPGVYASRSVFENDLDRIISDARLGGHRKWDADWTTHPHINDGSDITQWTNTSGEGLNDDRSLARPSAFPEAAHVNRHAPHGIMRATLLYDTASQRWHAQGEPGINVQLGGEDRYSSVEVQVSEAKGDWRTRSMPYNAPPLGGPHRG